MQSGRTIPRRQIEERHRHPHLIVADDYCGINQYGAKRDKAQLIELWTSFPIRSLTTESAEVRITGDTALVTGTQTEVNGMGTEHMAYMRVYVKSAGPWKLLAAMQSIPRAT